MACGAGDGDAGFVSNGCLFASFFTLFVRLLDDGQFGVLAAGRQVDVRRLSSAVQHQSPLTQPAALFHSVGRVETDLVAQKKTITKRTQLSFFLLLAHHQLSRGSKLVQNDRQNDLGVRR